MSLSCAGADSVNNLGFIGSNGRYLATYTGKDVIVWDLIANTSALYPSKGLILELIIMR